MSIIAGAPYKDFTDFKGAQFLKEPTDLAPYMALQAMNCEFIKGQVRSRRGMFYLRGAGDTDLGLFDAYETLVDVFQYKYANPASATLMEYVIVAVKDNLGKCSIRVVNANDTTERYKILTDFAGYVTKMKVVQYGSRVYISLLSLNNIPFAGIYVWDPTIHGPAGSGKPLKSYAFLPPLRRLAITVGAANVAGGGVVEAGSFYYGFLFTTASGFTTRVGPISETGEFSPYLAVVGAGESGNVSVDVTLSGMPFISGENRHYTHVELIWSAKNSQKEFFIVPGSRKEIPNNPAASITFRMPYADSELRRKATPADDMMDLISYPSGDVSSPNPPFGPSSMFLWGSRMVWVTYYGGQPGIFVSEPANPEMVSASANFITLPGEEACTAGVPTQPLLYLFTKTGTHAYSDNGGKPVTFSAPITISDSIGVNGSECVASRKGSAYIFVTSNSGHLYALSGSSYTNLPLSYYQTPKMEELGWNFSAYFQLVDHSLDKTIYLKAKKVDGTDVLYTWNYADGVQADKVKFSQTTSELLTIEYIYLAQSIGKSHTELWYLGSGVGTATPLSARQASILCGDDTVGGALGDVYMYYDVYKPIRFVYQTPYLPLGFNPEVYQFLGYHLRMLGLGTFKVSAISLDKSAVSKASNALNIVLSKTPSRAYFGLLDNQAEGISFKFEFVAHPVVPASSGRIALSAIRLYLTPLAGQR